MNRALSFTTHCLFLAAFQSELRTLKRLEARARWNVTPAMWADLADAHERADRICRQSDKFIAELEGRRS